GKIGAKQDSLGNTGGWKFDKDYEIIDTAPVIEGIAPLFATLEIPNPARQRNMDDRLGERAGQLFGYFGRGGEDVVGEGGGMLWLGIIIIIIGHSAVLEEKRVGTIV